MPEPSANDLLRELLAAQGTGNNDLLAALVSEDFVYNEYGTQRLDQNKDEWLNIWQEWRRVLPDVKGTIESMFVGGDHAAAETTWSGTFEGVLESSVGSIPPTGRKVENWPIVFLVTARGGKLNKINLYFDLMTLLEQMEVTVKV